MTTTEIPGRGRRAAQRVLAAALAAGLPASSVRTTAAGYSLPTEALESYEEIAKLSDEEFDSARKVGVVDGGIRSFRLAGDDDPEEEAAEPAESAESDDEGAEPELEYPKGNASQEAWETFAHEHFDYDPEEGLSRNELVEKYGKSATAAE